VNLHSFSITETAIYNYSFTYILNRVECTGLL